MNYTPSTSFMTVESRKPNTSGKKAVYILAGLALVALVGFVAFRTGESSFASSHKLFLQDYEEIEKAWQDFKNDYKRVHLTAEEHDLRFEIFATNYRTFKEMNANPAHTFTVGVNQFADMTDEEFAQGYLGSYDESEIEEDMPRAQLNYDSTPIDFTQYLGPAKYQNACGGCYSFSANAATEAGHNYKHGEQVVLSEQWIITCGQGNGNKGCHGGAVKTVYEFYKAKGTVYASDLAYNADDTQPCNIDLPRSPVKVDGWNLIGQPTKNVDLIAQLSQTPINIGVTSSSEAFKSYKSGIVNICPGGKNDHAVAVVAYRNDLPTIAPNGYFVVRNSWGSWYGQKGYIYLAANDADGVGTCGMNGRGTAPIIL